MCCRPLLVSRAGSGTRPAARPVEGCCHADLCHAEWAHEGRRSPIADLTGGPTGKAGAVRARGSSRTAGGPCAGVPSATAAWRWLRAVSPRAGLSLAVVVGGTKRSGHGQVLGETVLSPCQHNSPCSPQGSGTFPASRGILVPPRGRAGVQQKSALTTSFGVQI